MNEEREQDTYDGWRRRGYYVHKGAKALRYDVKREAHIFDESQVSPVIEEDGDYEEGLDELDFGRW